MSLIVVDDEELIRMTVCDVLEDAGYKIVAASNGVEAMRLLGQIDCELIITDLMMPYKDGIELCREIRAQYPNVRIVAMSGASVPLRYFATDREFADVAVLEKPFTRDSLVETVRQTLAK